MKTRGEKKTAFILVGVSSFLTFWLVFMYLRDPQQFIEHRLGINPEAFNHPIVWILTFVIAIGYIMYTAKGIPFVRDNLFTISSLKVIGIWIAIVSSTIEEILFRQILMDWLMSLDFSITLQVLASAILFGLAHSAWVLLGGDLKIALPAILGTTVLGGLLAILYIVGDRNILAPIVAHILINLFIEPWLILAAVTGDWKNIE
ncbi:CPBP family intramembrane metalloprotease [Salicibibacter halophilus]|uniref:CPBP family intramembrane metalloprotease n=1 Tax=Salicibibacter halophilus TaxID=2502791 RepID=A0A514LMR0_9BACI|nr:CPBP family intramembrane glutamic endopeptidase [Salicibibacter halophilus]QDI92551.1 CPBP family intramembrane metalloprotease [Salicibibacter halophilus]